MTEEKSKLREKYRLEMVKYQFESIKLRNLIENLDEEEKTLWRNSVLNKSFKTNIHNAFINYFLNQNPFYEILKN